jgi:hypothetical protein
LVKNREERGVGEFSHSGDKEKPYQALVGKGF